MADEKTIAEYISEIDELLEVSTFMQSGQVDEALGTIVKIINKPDIPPQAATQIVVKLQAISAVCAVQAAYYKNITTGKAGSEEYKRKNMFYSLHEAINELVAALKYLCR